MTIALSQFGHKYDHVTLNIHNIAFDKTHLISPLQTLSQPTHNIKLFMNQTNTPKKKKKKKTRIIKKINKDPNFKKIHYPKRNETVQITKPSDF